MVLIEARSNSEGAATCWDPAHYFGSPINRREQEKTTEMDELDKASLTGSSSNSLIQTQCKSASTLSINFDER